MYLKDCLGLKFIEPQSSDLTFMFKESSATMPLLFVLSPGTDPAADLYKFADKVFIYILLIWIESKYS